MTDVMLQLRRYQLTPETLDEFVRWWRDDLLPVRRSFGFEVPFACFVPEADPDHYDVPRPQRAAHDLVPLDDLQLRALDRCARWTARVTASGSCSSFARAEPLLLGPPRCDLPLQPGIQASADARSVGSRTDKPGQSMVSPCRPTGGCVRRSARPPPCPRGSSYGLL